MPKSTLADLIHVRNWMPVILLLALNSASWAQSPHLVVQTGHSSSVTTVALDPNGKILASGSDDHTIRLWDVVGGRELRTLKGHSRRVHTVVFSTDGQTLISGSVDSTIKLWDVASGSEIRSLKSNCGSVNAVVFSSDERMLASGCSDKTIRLWDVAGGRELRTLKGHFQFVNSVAFSVDGQRLASRSADKTIKVWDVASGRELRTLEGVTGLIDQVAFSGDGQTLANGSENQIKIWDIASGRELRTMQGNLARVYALAFSRDGKTLASAFEDKTIKLWDVASGRELRSLPGHPGGIYSLAFSGDGKTLAGGSADKTVKVWDVASGREISSLIGHSDPVRAVAFSSAGNMLASGCSDQTIKLWDLAGGRELRTLQGHSNVITSIAFSGNGQTLASASWDDTIKLWDVASGRELRTLTGHESAINSAAFSRDGRTLASGSYYQFLVGKQEETIILWDVASGRVVRRIAETTSVYSVAFSPDGKTLASGGEGSIKLWDVANGKEIFTLKGHSKQVNSVAFSRDGRTLASSSEDKTIKLWDLAGKSELHTLRGHSASVNSLAFSEDGQVIASGSDDMTIKLWDVASGTEVQTLRGHSAGINSVAISGTGQTLASGSSDSFIKLWSMPEGKTLMSLVVLDQRDWVVTDPFGRFDVSPDAQKLMYWRTGPGLYDLIALNQLKERYYEPGLLRKILGFNKEPLRNVGTFENPKLNPDVQLEFRTKDSSTLKITLTNRGGGIGRVQILVNGKEFQADARDENLRQNPNVSRATLEIDLSKAIGVGPGDNRVRVIAWNVENYISSRGTDDVWTVEGPTDRTPPEVYAIIGGISNYDGAHLNLNFAAKDAVDMSRAIELGAKRLFGADKVHLTLLTTADEKRAVLPSKENFKTAFAEARKAKPTDILIVYLAGHGIALQAGNSTYCYLTKEARTTDSAVLSDPAVRNQTAITSEELTEWVKQIPTLKQVVVLDTCAAGAVQEQLKLIDRRELSGDAIRALDRTTGRTGSYILMGSAADAPSYEASQFGQGLLTYALLKGMNGPALRDDEFVDVSRLFQYARDEVEQLAKNIGGIQKPVAFSPKDESFAVGQLTRGDRQKIAVASPKPMILRPRFFDEQADDDTLDLMKLLRARLRDESFITGRGVIQSTLVFVDDEEFPGGIRPTGRYLIEGNRITVTLRLRRDGREIDGPQIITGTKNDLASLVDQMIEVVKVSIRKLQSTIR